MAYPGHILRAYRDGSYIDVFTNLTDDQAALAKELCLQVNLGTSHDLGISDPTVVIYSSDDVILASGPVSRDVAYCTA